MVPAHSLAGCASSGPRGPPALAFSSAPAFGPPHPLTPSLPLRSSGRLRPSVRRSLRAQGSTEYVILFAVVIVLALVAIALLAFIPDSAFAIRSSESGSYWQSAKPFSIIESTLVENGTLMMLVTNAQADGLILESVSASGDKLYGIYGTSVYVGGGGAVELAFPVVEAPPPDSTYSFMVNLTYTNPISHLHSTQTGAVPLVGIVSDVPVSAPSGPGSGSSRPNGAACDSSGQCLSGHCYLGVCVECSADADCPAGKSCIELVCQ